MTIHDRIAVRAYHLWEAAGRPHGQDEDHWLAAEIGEIATALNQACDEQDERNKAITVAERALRDKRARASAKGVQTRKANKIAAAVIEATALLRSPSWPS